jgi:hypothetical protein
MAEIKGVCNNPRGYYFDTPIYDLDLEREECGMRSCRYCPHFLSKQELEGV